MGIKLFSFILLCTLNLYSNERLVSLSPSITEIIFALGKGGELVATSSYSLHPKEAKKLPIIGGYTNPNLEKIIILSPTLVIGQTFNNTTLHKLEKFHIDTLQVQLKTINDIKNSITQIAQKLDALPQAQKLLSTIDTSIKNIQKTDKPHSVMIVYGLYEDLRNKIYIAGHNIFFDDIIKLTGNTNAYTNKSTNQPVLSYENVIALNPDQIIILHSKASESKVNVKKALKAWYALPTNAAKNKKISIIDDDYLHIPSHRIALTIKKLSDEMRDD